MPPPVFDGKVHVMESRCSTCIFRPGNLMNLNPGRLKDLTEQTDANQGHVICHKTLDRKVGAICRGSYDRRTSDLVQIAERMGYLLFDGKE